MPIFSRKDPICKEKQNLDHRLQENLKHIINTNALKVKDNVTINSKQIEVFQTDH